MKKLNTKGLTATGPNLYLEPRIDTVMILQTLPIRKHHNHPHVSPHTWNTESAALMRKMQYVKQDKL